MLLEHIPVSATTAVMAWWVVVCVWQTRTSIARIKVSYPSVVYIIYIILPELKESQVRRLLISTFRTKKRIREILCIDRRNYSRAKNINNKVLLDAKSITMLYKGWTRNIFFYIHLFSKSNMIIIHKLWI